MKKSNILKLFLLLPAFAVCVFVFYFIFNFYETNYQQKSIYNSQNITGAPTSPIIEEKEVGTPIHIKIPAINVEANIQYVGLTEKGAIGDPEGGKDVAWFNQSPKPGEKGNSIVTGHYGTWPDGSGSVFDNLHKLKTGDKIFITDNKNQTFQFEVQYLEMYNFSDQVPKLFEKSDTAHLNLITCDSDLINGRQVFSRRLIIFSNLVE